MRTQKIKKYDLGQWVQYHTQEEIKKGVVVKIGLTSLCIATLIGERYKREWINVPSVRPIPYDKSYESDIYFINSLRGLLRYTPLF